MKSLTHMIFFRVKLNMGSLIYMEKYRAMRLKIIIYTVGWQILILCACVAVHGSPPKGRHRGAPVLLPGHHIYPRHERACSLLPSATGMCLAIKSIVPPSDTPPKPKKLKWNPPKERIFVEFRKNNTTGLTWVWEWVHGVWIFTGQIYTNFE